MRRVILEERVQRRPIFTVSPVAVLQLLHALRQLRLAFTVALFALVQLVLTPMHRLARSGGYTLYIFNFLSGDELFPFFV
jgi:hypothetical protein